MKFYVCFKKKKKRKKAPLNVCFWGESEEEGVLEIVLRRE